MACRGFGHRVSPFSGARRSDAREAPWAAPRRSASLRGVRWQRRTSGGCHRPTLDQRRSPATGVGRRGPRTLATPWRGSGGRRGRMGDGRGASRGEHRGGASASSSCASVYCQPTSCGDTLRSRDEGVATGCRLCVARGAEACGSSGIGGVRRGTLSSSDRGPLGSVPPRSRGREDGAARLRERRGS